MDEGQATNSFASVAAKTGSADGYKVVARRKRFAKNCLTITQETITTILVSKRHLSVRFGWARDTKFILRQGITVGRIRDCLNNTLYALHCWAYFSVTTANKWGDILLTLAATNVVDGVGYDPARQEALKSLGLYGFTLTRDTEKVKAFVGQVPLSCFGGGWKPSEWEGRVAYEHLAADIEQSHPRVMIAAHPSWEGRLNKLKECKAQNAELIHVLEMTSEVKHMLAASQPRLAVAGRPHFCHLLLREANPTIVCARCQTVGCYASECKTKPVCAFCHKGHLTMEHLYPIISCRKKRSA